MRSDGNSNGNANGRPVVVLGTHRYKAHAQKVTPGEDALAGRRRCFLGVSLGNAKFEGAKLEACLAWISEHFEACAVAIADSSYRLTLQLNQGLTPDEARPLALRAGREFVDRNRALFDRYARCCRFEYLPDSALETWPEFPRELQRMQALYDEDSRFRAEARLFAQQYLGFGGREPADPLLRELPWFKEQAAVLYLLEEAAIFAMLNRAGWPVFVYPGPMRIFEKIASGELPGMPDELRSLALVELRLSRKGAYFDDGAVKAIMLPAQAAPEPAVPHLDLIEAYARPVDFQARQRIIAKGEESDSLYFLVCGRVAIYLPVDGVQGQIATLSAPAVFGEQAFLDGLPRSATVVGDEPRHAYVLSPAAFQQLRDDHPQEAIRLLAYIARVQSTRKRANLAQSHLWINGVLMS